MNTNAQVAPQATNACNVIPLPTAAAEKVVQNRYPRNTSWPKNVTRRHLWNHRLYLKREAARENAEEALFDARAALHMRVVTLISYSAPAQLKQIESALLAHNLPLGG